MPSTLVSAFASASGWRAATPVGRPPTCSPGRTAPCTTTSAASTDGSWTVVPTCAEVLVQRTRETGQIAQGPIGGCRYNAVTTLREVRGSRTGVSWRPRPVVALALRIGAVLAPLVAACLAALLLTHTAPDDLSPGAVWLWRAVVIAAGTATSFLVERYLRRV